MENDFFMTIDTETTNSLDDPFVYDLGLAIHNAEGEVFHTESLVIAEIFYDHALMKNAFFAEKIPSYMHDISTKKRKVVSFFTARMIVRTLIKRYNVKAIIAHNAYFDYNALNTTLKYLTNSRSRFFLPFGTPLWDSLRMAQTSLARTEDYKKYCQRNNYLTPRGRIKLTAEVIYRYITNNHAFMEEHSGLADVMIEKDITAYLLKMNHASMKKCLFNPQKEEDAKTMLEWFEESLLME
jgi:hypothetical protein